MFKKNTDISTLKDIESSLLVLSDIHADKDTDYTFLYKVLDRIKDKGDTSIICSLGDTLNDGLDIETAKRISDVYEKFSRVAPLVIIPGNHDKVTCKNGRWLYIKTPEDLLIYDKIVSLYKSIPNTHYLSNEGILIDGINFFGIDMPISYYKSENANRMMASDLLESLDINANDYTYNIFLSHSPINFMENDFVSSIDSLKNFDLFLAGHMHNGLLPCYLEHFVPGNYGLLGRVNGKSKYFPPYSKGNVKINDHQTGVIANPYCTFSSEKVDKLKYNKFYPKVMQTVKIRKLVK